MTEYVVTRWYRAPELLADSQQYTGAVDVWSIGCIFAEMLQRRAFFQGRDPAHQLRTICKVLGTPKTQRAVSFVTNETAREALESMPIYEPKSLRADVFPDYENPDAIDLLEKMLQFHPNDRISIEEVRTHPLSFYCILEESEISWHRSFRRLPIGT